MTHQRWVFLGALATVVLTHLLSLFFIAAETVEVFVQVLVAVVALALLYLVLSGHVDRLTESIRELTAYVHSQLKAPIYEADPHRVVSHLEEVVATANEYVYAVGGRARDTEYLEAIADKIRQGTAHIRIIEGDHILHPLHEHLERLLEAYDPEDPDSEFHLGWYLDERFGHFTVSDSEVLISASNPRPRTPLQSVLRIADPALSRRYRDYVNRLYFASTKVGRASPLLTNLCEDCSPVIKEVVKLKETIRRTLEGIPF